MLALTIRMQEDIRLHENFRRAGFARIVKEALAETALYWHGRYLPHHFKRDAYSRYRYLGLYRKQKRAGEPMVESGSLRDRVTAKRMRADVSGTSKKATITLRFGRPPQYTEAEIRRRILSLIKRRGMTYRQAERTVYSTAGYSREGKEMFRTHIPAVAGSEVQSLRACCKKQIVDALNERGGKRTVTIQ